MSRRCTRRGCGKLLAGKRGHGFVTRDGRGVECSTCAYPTKEAPRLHAPAEARA